MLVTTMVILLQIYCANLMIEDSCSWPGGHSVGLTYSVAIIKESTEQAFFVDSWRVFHPVTVRGKNINS